MSEPELAQELLATIPSSERGAAATHARLAWFYGELDAAVAHLQAAIRDKRATSGELALERRLSSERQLLTDFHIDLNPVKGYSPRTNAVLHVVTNSLPHTTSGYAQRTHNILVALAQEGWDVHAVTRAGYPVQVGKVLARGVDVVDGIPYHRVLPAKLAPTATERLEQQALAVLELALRVRPSVLHTTTHYVNAQVTRAVAEALGIPWVYEVRGLLADTWASTHGPDAEKSQRYRAFQRSEALALLSASRVVTLASTMAARLREIAHAPELQIDLAPNSVGSELLEDAGFRADTRQQLGLPVQGFLVGTVTSVVEYEGLDDLLRAVAMSRHTVPSIQAVIVGSGVALPGLKTLARELGIADIVTFPGRVDRVHAAQYLHALDVVTVVRKDREVTRTVTPLKPVEAMARGAVVVASDLPALREIIVHEETGVLTPAEDPASLAAVLQTLASDESARLRLSRAAKEWVATNRTWRVTAQEASARYREMIGDDHGAANDSPTSEESAS